MLFWPTSPSNLEIPYWLIGLVTFVAAILAVGMFVGWVIWG